MTSMKTAEPVAPHIAAERARAAFRPQPTSLVPFESRGAVLVLGEGATASEAVERLGADLQVTFLGRREIFQEHAAGPVRIEPADVIVDGHLGAYRAYAVLNGKGVDLGAALGRESFDLVLDLRETPQFNSEMQRFGFYAPLDDRDALEKALEELPTLVGRFEKPKYFAYAPDICAHGSSGLHGCSRCIEACPAEAIVSVGTRIEVNPHLCQGGGTCSTVCPSGALSYSYPSLRDTLEQIQHMLRAYREAGGTGEWLLFHSGETADWLKAHRHGLGSHFLPFPVEELGSVGLEVWLAALAFGVRGVALLSGPETPARTLEACDEQVAVGRALLAAMGFDTRRLGRYDIHAVEHEPRLFEAEAGEPDSFFLPTNDKRQVLHFALDRLHGQSPDAPELVPLPAGSPFGRVMVDDRRCTLCMACVSVCPGRALFDGGDTPQLNFLEADCLQCGLCATACPEQALSLEARYRFGPERDRRRTLHEESPFHCEECGKPFATASAIGRVKALLKDHAVFQGKAACRLNLCETCRVRDLLREELEAQGG